MTKPIRPDVHARFQRILRRVDEKEREAEAALRRSGRADKRGKKGWMAWAQNGRAGK